MWNLPRFSIDLFEIISGDEERVKTGEKWETSSPLLLREAASFHTTSLCPPLRLGSSESPNPKRLLALPLLLLQV